MNGLRAIVCALVISAGLPAAMTTFVQAEQPQWYLGGARNGYSMDAAGWVTDSAGATVAVRSVNGGETTFGAAIAKMPADSLRGRRFTLAGEMQTERVSGTGASLWMRVDSGAVELKLDNGSDRAQRGSRSWTKRSVSMMIPAGATSVVFGVLLAGTGAVEVRHLRIEIEPARPRGGTAP